MIVLADAFATVTALILVGGVLVLLAIGRWHGRSGTDIMDEDRKDRWAAQERVERHDVGQMVGAANARRARRGEAPRSTTEVVDEVQREELMRLREGS